MLDEQSLQFVLVKRLAAKFDILMTDVSEDGGLRVEVVIVACFGYDAALNVAEEDNAVDFGPESCTKNLL